MLESRAQSDQVGIAGERGSVDSSRWCGSGPERLVAHMKRALMISYMFPPTGGSGVQRSLKYTKYLPEFGWDVSVLTVRDLAYDVRDHSLLDELPKQTRIVRTESADPLRVAEVVRQSRRRRGTLRAGDSTVAAAQVVETSLAQDARALSLYRRLRTYASLPDVQIAWIPFAVRAGLREIEEASVDAIVGRMPPHTDGVVAHLLARKTGIPYVLDFADGWMGDPYLELPNQLYKRVNLRLEEKVVCGASGLAAATKTIGRRFQDRYPGRNGPVEWLPNGFDDEDLPVVVSSKSGAADRRLIVYMGSLYVHHQPNLDALIQALLGLPDELRNKLRVEFVGRNYDGAKRAVGDAGLDSVVHFTGYVDHATAVQRLMAADASILFVKPGDHESLTGKVFEYLMNEGPLIASIEPDSELGDLLTSVGRGHCIVAPEDSEGLRQLLLQLDGDNWPRHGTRGMERFSRRNNAARLAQMLDRAVAD